MPGSECSRKDSLTGVGAGGEGAGIGGLGPQSSRGQNGAVEQGVVLKRSSTGA